MRDQKPNPLNTRAFCGLWATGIAVLSLLPANVAVTTGWSDKIEHGLAFAILAILAQVGWRNHPALITVSLCVFYGGVIELAQTLSPGRHADIWDLVADAMGAGLGILVTFVWARVQKRSTNHQDE